MNLSSIRCSVFSFAVLAASSAVLFAQGAAPVASGSASSTEESEYAALKVRYDKAYPDNVGDPGEAGSTARREWARLVDEKWRRDAEAYLAFYRDHPDSPHRWEAAWWYLQREPGFVVGYKPGYDSNPTPDGRIVDQDTRAAWERNAAELRSALDKATDLPLAIEEALAREKLLATIQDAWWPPTKKRPIDLKALRAAVDAHLAKYPTVPGVGLVVSSYMNAVGATDRSRVESEWASFANSPIESLRKKAEGQIGFANLKRKPVEMKFTAVDGREVDLVAMRGKVVLLDFWATWCGPCKAELPNVVAAYKKYHDKGFEIVGISLDESGDRQKLIEFTKTHDMPWPQHFDGKVWAGELVHQFGVLGIPAAYLLDKNGMIVSESARGPALEKDIEQQLGL